MPPDTQRLPLRVRDDPGRAEDFQILREDVPDWLQEPLAEWIRRRVWVGDGLNYHWHAETRLSAQAALHLTIPEYIPDLPVEHYLDVIDYLIPTGRSRDLEALEKLLATGGSVWRVDRNGLVRRVDETMQSVADSVVSRPERPARHLRDAWRVAWGRSTDATAAYREAVRAVEAAYAPIVSPKNDSATLGTIIADIRNKPSKFSVRLRADEDDANVERLLGMLQMLWKSQFDRHGTDDDAVPLNVSIDEARDAVALATTLVHLAQQGGFTANGS